MNLFSRLGLSILSAVVLPLAAFAQGHPSVVPTYTPGTKIIQSTPLPIVPNATPDPSFPVNPYYLTITSPTGVSYPVDVPINFGIATAGNVVGGVKTLPGGVSDTTALSYISANPATLHFTGANQSLNTVVTVKIDATQATTAVTGDYGYEITTAWPAAVPITDPNTGDRVLATINITVAPPPPKPTPPTISNIAPVDGTNFTYDPATGTPISFSIGFDANVVGGAATDKITGLAATIDGDAFNGVNSYSRSADNPPEVLAALVTTGVQSLSAHGSVTSPRITDGGPHTITVTAYSATTPSVSATTTINVRTPPKITSADNVTFTIGRPGSFTVTATGFPAPSLSLAAGTLPAGLAFDSSTGILSGTPTAGGGSRTLTFRATNVVRPNGVDQIFTLTINKADQVINFGALGSKSVTTGSFTLTATGGDSGNPVTYTSSNPAVATVSGSTVTILATGTTTITANQAGNDNYNAAAPVSQSLFVDKVPQVITFAALPAKQIGDPTFTLTATGGGSGNPVTFISSDPSVATVSGNTVTIVAAGTTTVIASQAGNTNYYDAVPVSRTLTVRSSTGPTCGTVVVRHGPDLNGQAMVDGSLQVLLPEKFSLNGEVVISHDLLVAGSPTIKANGHPSYAITDGTGSATPTNYTITLDGNVALGHVVRRTDPVIIPVIPTPPASTGTRDVKLNKSDDSAGDFSTVRDLTVNGNVGPVAVPAGTYRDLTVTGNSSLILGTSGATAPSVYNVRSLKFTGNSTLVVVGPVILTVAKDVTFNGDVGNAAHPEWLALGLSSGDLTLDGKLSLSAYVVAPAGKVTINGQGKLCGGLMCDSLTMNGQALIDVCGCDDTPADGTGSGAVTPPYPFVSANPRTNIAFSESDVLRGFVISADVNGNPQALQVFYNDEHALTLGISEEDVLTGSAKNKIKTATTFAIAPASASPGSVSSPLLGDLAGTDASGRPIYPSLFITDITADPASLVGDWQYGGAAFLPDAIFGTWKSAIRTVDNTVTPSVVSVTPGADPAKNNWNLGPGADPVPAGFGNEGYGAEIRWDLAHLNLVGGHTYRFYFMVHDGDQNKVGGDAGQGSVIVTIPGR